MEAVFISLICICALIVVVSPFFRSTTSKPKPGTAAAEYDVLWKNHGHEFQALFLEIQSHLGGSLDHWGRHYLRLKLDQVFPYREIWLRPRSENQFEISYSRSGSTVWWGRYQNVSIAGTEVLKNLKQGMFDSENPEMTGQARKAEEERRAQAWRNIQLENRTHDEVDFAKRKIDEYWQSKRDEFDDDMEDRLDGDDYWTPR